MLQTKRVIFIDYLRGFIIAIMAFDHALHAYAFNWGKFWFFRDYNRTIICDWLYLFNQSIIMPMLFFTLGFYCLSKMETQGLWKFIQDKLVKYAIPFVIGISIIVPLLSYPRFIQYDNGDENLITYYLNFFHGKHLQAGPFWVMYAILIYNFILILINKARPNFIKYIANIISQAVHNGWKYLIIFALFSIVVFSLSDLWWGAPYWIGFYKIFYLQGAKFIMNFVYFTLGAAFYHSQIFNNVNIWSKFIKMRYKLLLAVVIIGILYSGYSVHYLTNAYGPPLAWIMKQKPEFITQYLNLSFIQKIPMILIRTSLLSILLISQMLALLAWFSYFCHKKESIIANVSNGFAINCYGIFIFHESITVWGQYLLINYNINIFFKILLIFIFAVSISYLVVNYLQKFSLAKRILELD